MHQSVLLSSWDRSHQNANVGFENANVGSGEQYRQTSWGQEEGPRAECGSRVEAGMKGGKEAV